MYYVYLIKSLIKNWCYVGSTDDLKKRFSEHNSGKVKSTKPYRPFDIAYYEAYAEKIRARKREIELKTNNQQKEFLYKRLFDL